MFWFVRRKDLNTSNRTRRARGDSLLNVLAFTVIDQPPGSAHCSRVDNVTKDVKKMLNGPQTLSVDRVITAKLRLSTPVVLP